MGSLVTRWSAEPVPGAPSCSVGESPRWHEGAWWWVDAPVGRVYRATAHEGGWDISRWLDAGLRVSMIHPAGLGRMLVAHGSALWLHRSSDAGVERVVADFDLPPGWVLNDATVDAAGVCWIGVVAPEGQRDAGWLARVAPDGSVRRVVESVQMSNGLAATVDGSSLYHADSQRRVVWRHRLSGAGEVIASDEFLRIPDEEGMPDGLALDDQERLWVAVYGAGEVRCHTPTGRPVAAITIPVPQSTSLCFGGSDGRTVLVTSAREGYSERARRERPLAGTIFRSSLPSPTRRVNATPAEPDRPDPVGGFGD